MYEYETSKTKLRLAQFLKKIGSNNNQFVVKMGYASNFLNSKSGISEDRLTEISIAYSNLNMNWLLTGDGEMFKNISENSEKLKQNDESIRNNSIDFLIREQVKEAVMENIPAIITAVMDGMNKQMEGQNQVINKQLDMLQEVIRSLADLNNKSDKIQDNILKLSRKAQ